MSKRIPRAFIDELLARSDIVELINGYVSLRKAGKDFSACCPFHDEKTPSFTVSPDKQFYYCFGCGAKGNAVSFLMDYAHLDFVEAIQELANRQGMQIPYEGTDEIDTSNSSQRQALLDLLKQVAQFYQQQLRQHPNKQQAVDYLKKRGLSGEISASFGLGFAPPGWDNVLKAFGQTTEKQKLLFDAGLLIEKEQGGGFYDRFRHRIMFPIQDRRGQVIAFGGRVLDDSKPKYLNSPETRVFHKGQELYGLYAARNQRPSPDKLLIVEGYIDVVSLAQFGVRNAVATLGTATSTEHLNHLFRLVNQVVFCFDGDEAGRKAAWRGLEIAMPLLREGREARFMFLPDGEDPDTLVRKEGTEAFQQRIQQALPLAEFLFQYLAEQFDVTKNLSGQMQLLEHIKPILQKMPEGPAKQLLQDRLGSIDLKNASQLVPTPSVQATQNSDLNWKSRIQGERQRNAALHGHPPKISLMRTVVGLLIQYPTLIEYVPELPETSVNTVSGSDLLKQVVQFIRCNPNCNTGSILEHWRNSEYANALHKLATLDYYKPENDVSVETVFCDAIKNLITQAREQRLDTLLQKSRFSSLESKEMEELKRLLQHKAGKIH